jgi:aminoglycoside phosphotransferase (APT) family kinase protein
MFAFAVLAAADITGYLLDRKLLSPRAVVHGRLRVEDVSRLNHVFVVTAEGERCYVVKLAGPAGHAGVAHEAAVLERLASPDPTRPLAAYLPRLVGYDGADGVLILESAPRARDLRRHHAHGRFSCALARQAGRAMALLHAIPPATLEGLTPPPHPTARSRVHRLDLDTMFTLSGAALELTSAIQASGDLCASIDELCAGWPEESVIHGDIRWDNWLVVGGGDPNRWSRLQLIDWELCTGGDPAYDIGAFLGEYLRAWLRSIPIADPRDPARLLAHARLPLRRMRPALRAFWSSYAQHRGAAPAPLARTLHRSTRYAAVRLLGAALEEAQALTELRASVRELVPLSDKILRSPRAVEDLLGLGAWQAAA